MHLEAQRMREKPRLRGLVLMELLCLGGGMVPQTRITSDYGAFLTETDTLDSCSRRLTD